MPPQTSPTTKPGTSPVLPCAPDLYAVKIMTPRRPVTYIPVRLFRNLITTRLVKMAMTGLCLILTTNLFAQPVEVLYPEGVSEGFVTLKTLDGKKLADGELSQATTGADRLASRLTFRFADGSLYDEIVTFSQKKHFTLLSYQLTQRGPAFPESLTISLNGETDNIKSSSTRKRRMKK